MKKAIGAMALATGLTCFRIASQAQTFIGPDGIALHRFSPLNGGTNSDGANPAASLAFIGGVLIGTTLNGGLQGNGAAFYLGLDGTNFINFHSFTSPPDAGNPQGSLVVSGNAFFGTSLGGGKSGVGSVFLGYTNGSVSRIQSFAVVSADEATNSGGASPSALLVLSGNILYGTTTAGGAAANGTVFSLSTNGSTFADLHDFSALDSNTGTNADGSLPCSGLVLSGNTLYGTASAGGAGGAGVVFSINTNGGSLDTLYSFTSLDSLAATNTDGAFPASGLVESNGTLYGTTLAGGTGGRGVVFSV
ncbi:MAG TPA: choice-of-anchor tandem repeat GloVer-containing protein, partial [Candidatus Acidoferrum sp.]|nr:choice-of-anchor tandem repeat GloVer-containing protein [Candidatus Acidoferrum sp.]